MIDKVRTDQRIRLLTGLMIGLVFGFLLQKGGATEYEVIINQLLLRDFTVLKIIFSAVLTGMVGVYVLVSLGVAYLSPKPCEPWAITVGGLIFGTGFAVLGYCPGTMAGAVGTGSVHALMGIMGVLIGVGLYASQYSHIHKKLNNKTWGNITIPGMLNVNPWIVVFLMSLMILGVLYAIEVST
ncbi:YeeE/YedE thiosulfate transporter family protein [Vibrio sp.]|uniref:YeeE/YedE thiosulfate transporter family protein n=1 Tax=Vibrio sp. TaxID=678 RepID=UPI003D0E1473